MTWLQKGQTLANFVPTKKTSSKTINRFVFKLNKGESTRISILNPDDAAPPVMHYHQIFDVERNMLYLVACSMPENGYCHFCEYAKLQPEGAQWKHTTKKVSCYSILDLTENTDKDGKVYPLQRNLRLTQESQMKDLQKAYHTCINDLDFPSLQYTILKAARPNEDKSASIGEITPLKRLDTASYDPELLKPLTEDEILSYFTLSGSEDYEYLVGKHPLKETVSSAVKKKKP